MINDALTHNLASRYNTSKQIKDFYSGKGPGGYNVNMWYLGSRGKVDEYPKGEYPNVLVDENFFSGACACARTNNSALIPASHGTYIEYDLNKSQARTVLNLNEILNRPDVRQKITFEHQGTSKSLADPIFNNIILLSRNTKSRTNISKISPDGKKLYFEVSATMAIIDPQTGDNVGYTTPYWQAADLFGETSDGTYVGFDNLKKDYSGIDKDGNYINVEVYPKNNFTDISIFLGFDLTEEQQLKLQDADASVDTLTDLTKNNSVMSPSFVHYPKNTYYTFENIEIKYNVYLVPGNGDAEILQCSFVTNDTFSTDTRNSFKDFEIHFDENGKEYISTYFQGISAVDLTSGIQIKNLTNVILQTGENGITDKLVVRAFRARVPNMKQENTQDETPDVLPKDYDPAKEFTIYEGWALASYMFTLGIIVTSFNTNRITGGIEYGTAPIIDTFTDPITPFNILSGLVNNVDDITPIKGLAKWIDYIPQSFGARGWRIAYCKQNKRLILNLANNSAQTIYFIAVEPKTPYGSNAIGSIAYSVDYLKKTYPDFYTEENKGKKWTSFAGYFNTNSFGIYNGNILAFYLANQIIVSSFGHIIGNSGRLKYLFTLNDFTFPKNQEYDVVGSYADLHFNYTNGYIYCPFYTGGFASGTVIDSHDGYNTPRGNLLIHFVKMSALDKFNELYNSPSSFEEPFLSSETLGLDILETIGGETSYNFGGFMAEQTVLTDNKAISVGGFNGGLTVDAVSGKFAPMIVDDSGTKKPLYFNYDGFNFDNCPLERKFFDYVRPLDTISVM